MVYPLVIAVDPAVITAVSKSMPHRRGFFN
jgi:hypothetical protein